MTVRTGGRSIRRQLHCQKPSMTQTQFTRRRRWSQQLLHIDLAQVQGQQLTVAWPDWLPTHRHWSVATYQNLILCLTTSTHRPRCTRLPQWNDDRQVWHCLYVVVVVVVVHSRKQWSLAKVVALIKNWCTKWQYLCKLFTVGTFLCEWCYLVIRHKYHTDWGKRMANMT